MNHFLCKFLDYYIIIGSFVAKVPQLRKIWIAKSGEGIAMPSVTIELLAHCSKTAYAARKLFPFTSYGESAFFVFQNCAIGVLVLYYSKRGFASSLYPALTLVSMGILMKPELVDMKSLMLMQAGNLFVTIFSKLIQAITNMRNKGTGQLSKTTTSLYVSGLLARVYTSIQETGDLLIISRYLVSTFFNVVLLIQIIYYRRLAKNTNHSTKTTSATARYYSHGNGCVASTKTDESSRNGLQGTVTNGHCNVSSAEHHVPSVNGHKPHSN